MPSFLGELNNEEKVLVAKWLEDKLGRKYQCPFCASVDCVIGDHVIALLPAAHVPPVTYPVVIMVCQNCGQTQLFNSMEIGIATKPSDSATGAKNA